MLVLEAKIIKVRVKGLSSTCSKREKNLKKLARYKYAFAANDHL